MIDAFVTYMKANVAGFAAITHAKDQAPVDVAGTDLPLLGIFPGDDSTAEDGTDYLESKMLTSTLLVHLVCPIEDWETLRATVRTAAIGWSAGAVYTDLALVSGQILQLKGGVIWWEERYANRHIIRETY